LAEAVRLREDDRAEEARELLLKLSAEHPHDGQVAYQTAWVHDKLGLEHEAVPHYERALSAGDLSPDERRGALVGLGSTFRALGRYDEAVTTLARGSAEFPEDAAVKAFLSMALYNSGRYRESVSLLLKVLAATSADEEVRRYRRAIEFYAD